MVSRRLFLIPARGGSKGLAGKNTMLLNGIPLLHYSINIARQFAADKDILVSTDDNNIIRCANDAGLDVPFLRPAELATDDAGMHGVLLHAINMFAAHNDIYDQVVLLQPTSPLRQEFHLKEALDLYNDSLDMVVSVCHSKANPYFNLYEEDESGFLFLSKKADVASRQKAPPVYMLNGAIYIIRAASVIRSSSLSELKHIKKYVMDRKYSVDIDDETDWLLAGLLLNQISQQG